MIRFLPERKLSFAEVRLIPEVLTNLFKARILVSFRPSRGWMPKVSSGPFVPHNPDKLNEARLISGVINGLSRRTPWSSTCLVKALAAHKMLQKRKIDHTIHIGVSRAIPEIFKAHAWLSVGDDILMGGENLQGFHEISGFR